MPFRALDLGAILGSIHNGILAVDREGKIIYFNKSSEKIFNIEDYKANDRFIFPEAIMRERLEG